ncbi:MAG TPA: hypothetical protein VFV38_32955 [Ktedonobacteraceae bacterium]|nr:hypothetical protein [Ktedonobacteraceae bacterium]
MQTIATTSDDGGRLPILRIHTIARPFCDKPDCWCKENQRVITSLLLRINNTLLILEQVNHLKGEE